MVTLMNYSKQLNAAVAYLLPLTAMAFLLIMNSAGGQEPVDPPQSACGLNSPTKVLTEQVCGTGDAHGDHPVAKRSARNALGDALAGDACPDCATEGCNRTLDHDQNISYVPVSFPPGGVIYKACLGIGASVTVGCQTCPDE